MQIGGIALQRWPNYMLLPRNSFQIHGLNTQPENGGDTIKLLIKGAEDMAQQLRPLIATIPEDPSLILALAW